jgi:hypothetical protein
MQQIFYEAAPYALLVYPFQLEAYDTADWQGWVHVPGDATGGQKGAVLYSYNNIDTYRYVEPKTATAATTTSSGNTALIIVVVGVVLIVVVAAVLLLHRARGRAGGGAGGA